MCQYSKEVLSKFFQTTLIEYVLLLLIQHVHMKEKHEK